MGYVDFFFQSNLLPPYSLCSQGDHALANLCKFTHIWQEMIHYPDPDRADVVGVRFIENSLTIQGTLK